MLGEIAALLLASGTPSGVPAPLAAAFSGPAYLPARRAVTNWRLEALGGLDLAAVRAVRIATGTEKRLPRCVKLNNYWCIKRAGWDGEIAADGEGHVAFASAHEGAVVAVKLLRRYYLDFGRTSAMAIVSRWAPAQCFAAARTRARAGKRQLRHLARRGIGNTLRARWLARHGRGGVSKRPVRKRRSVAHSRVRARAAPMLRAPSISPGLGERAVPLLSAQLPPVSHRQAAAIRRERKIPRIGCTSEALRIRNYARRMIAGVASDTKADLKLFRPDGAATPALRRVMENMAAVEIGPLKAAPVLVRAAIAEAGGPEPERVKERAGKHKAEAVKAARE